MCFLGCEVTGPKAVLSYARRSDTNSETYLLKTSAYEYRMKMAVVGCLSWIHEPAVVYLHVVILKMNDLEIAMA